MFLICIVQIFKIRIFIFSSTHSIKSRFQEVLEVLEKVAMVVGQQIRRGNDLLAMERISSCDLNLKEQGNLLRHDTMYVTEKRGLQSKKRVRNVFLFENCVVLTKPKLSRSWRGSTFDELKYKSSIQVL